MHQGPAAAVVAEVIGGWREEVEIGGDDEVMIERGGWLNVKGDACHIFWGESVGG